MGVDDGRGDTCLKSDIREDNKKGAPSMYKRKKKNWEGNEKRRKTALQTIYPIGKRGKVYTDYRKEGNEDSEIKGTLIKLFIRKKKKKKPNEQRLALWAVAEGQA